VIVHNCHALSASSWKALLKSLESPPAWVYWFLCTTELGKVPANIKTRCATYGLKPVVPATLAELLRQIVDQEGLKTPKDIIKLCASEANGSPRQAIVNLEVCAETKTLEDAEELLETAGSSPAAIDLARALLRRESWKVVQGLLGGLRTSGVSAESVRHIVLAYMTSVALGAKSEADAGKTIEVLDAFSTPYPSGDGISPLIISCAKVLLS